MGITTAIAAHCVAILSRSEVPARVSRLIAVAIAAGAFAAVSPARADDFYKGKQITILIPFEAGSGYDTYARTLARHISEQIPGEPTIVPSNMIGGGGLVLANHLFTVAAKDGTAIGLLSRSNLVEPLLENAAARFDPRKFSWIGSMGDEVSMCAAATRSGFKTWEDLKRKEFIATASGAAADNGVYPLLFNALLGTKFKVVVGYKGGPAMNKALEDGEADGRCGWSWTTIKTTKPEWLANKTIVLLLQAGLKKAKDLPDVPLVLDLAHNAEDRAALEVAFSPQAVAWPIAAPPGLPAERLAILRKAFLATLRNERFLAEAKRLRLDIDPMDGEEIAGVVERMYAAPAPAVAKVRGIMKPSNR